MVIKEHGFPKFEFTSDRGDLFIEFSIAFPKALSADQRSAIAKF
jgi:DnaJ-class molecular chaperone